MTTRNPATRIALGATLVTAWLLAGCATPVGPSQSPGATTSTPSTAAVSPPTVSLTRSGGFAGVNQAITLDPTGAWTYTDKRAGQTQTGQLTPAQLGQLAVLALDPRLAQEVQATPDRVCNDAFQYALVVGPLNATFEDCGQSRPAVQAMLAFITDNTAF